MDFQQGGLPDWKGAAPLMGADGSLFPFEQGAEKEIGAGNPPTRVSHQRGILWSRVGSLPQVIQDL